MLPSALPAEVREALGKYVYALEDPRDGILFYVGRGVGDRVLAHSHAALTTDETGAKLDRIRAIHGAGLEPKVHILRSRLGGRSAAADIEATVIDVLLRWKVRLTNLVRGAGTECGIRTLDSILIDHAAEPLRTDRAAILVNINRTWSEDMMGEALWDAARKWWLCRPEWRSPPPTLMLAEASGITRGAWTIGNPPRRQVVRWADLDERRRLFWDSEAAFEPFEACIFDGVPDADWGGLVGRHTRDLPRAYGAAFRYLNC
ncbi:hypothetical protein KPL78_02575 [Roseomonas sp. HJA6]|uniref:GIY-YIG domain-containing protein n=1 Tax=Roseomonas alba TaxID=2846776 RepID=A0ABS7A5Z2_9PROT|nr:hypothetical protein [Neoroseomonas alba]MBW6396710.1 hypothetical protein [Neoroseomonas alba]